jgi:hypothetical protein
MPFIPIAPFLRLLSLKNLCDRNRRIVTVAITEFAPYFPQSGFYFTLPVAIAFLSHDLVPISGQRTRRWSMLIQSDS